MENGISSSTRFRLPLSSMNRSGLKRVGSGKIYERNPYNKASEVSEKPKAYLGIVEDSRNSGNNASALRYLVTIDDHVPSGLMENVLRHEITQPLDFLNVKNSCKAHLS